MDYILRFGEIALKGANRGYFENELKENILGFFPGVSLKKRGGRYYVEGPEGLNFRKLFGIVSYSPAVKLSLDYEEIEKEVLKRVEPEGSFAIASNRINKQYGLNSLELNEKLGQAVVDEYGLEVDLDNPDQTVGVEVAFDHAYVFTDKVECFGGLPVGCEGTVAAWIEDEKSLLAALLLMKRGCDVIPYGEDIGVDILESYGCGFDFRESDDISEVDDFDVKALVVNDTLKEFKRYDVSTPILRPLVGLTEEEIVERLEDYRGSIC